MRAEAHRARRRSALSALKGLGGCRNGPRIRSLLPAPNWHGVQEE